MQFAMHCNAFLNKNSWLNPKLRKQRCIESHLIRPPLNHASQTSFLYMTEAIFHVTPNHWLVSNKSILYLSPDYLIKSKQNIPENDNKF